MKKAISLLVINAVIIIFMASTFITGCVKEGPMGPAGVAGSNGTNGTNGTNGKDVTSLCLKCHSTKNIADIKDQYSTQQHVKGTTYLPEGVRADCAPCHSNQGYVEACATLTAGAVSTAATINPQPLQCQGCHDKHLTFDTVPDYNYALRAPETVKYRMDSTGIKKISSYQGCASCHQPRVFTPYPDVNKLATTQKISSYRYGTHYGTQVSALAGMGIEIPGATPYEKSHDKITKCTTCHMGTGPNNLSGGHTLKMRDADNKEVLVSTCTKCHTGATSYNINNRQTDIDALIKALGDKMNKTTQILETDANGNYTGYLYIKSGTTNPNAPTFQYLTNAQIASLINIQIAIRDKSHGVHNYKYIKALLKNSIDAI